MNLEEYCRAALEKSRARHRANGQDMWASYHWNGKRFVIEVMQHVVAEFPTIDGVLKFSAMHNRDFNAGGAA